MLLSPLEFASMNIADIGISQWHLDGLIDVGATTVERVLPEYWRKRCLNLADALPFIARSPKTATGVFQNFSAYDSFEPESPFIDLAIKTAEWLNRALRNRFPRLLISFNDCSLQRYPTSPPGQPYALGPHLDSKHSINLVAVYVLYGDAPFCVCQDRAGNGVREIKSKPGDLILMRGEGFLGAEKRPFHFIGPVKEERLSFGMRQSTKIVRYE